MQNGIFKCKKKNAALKCQRGKQASMLTLSANFMIVIAKKKNTSESEIVSNDLQMMQKK